MLFDHSLKKISFHNFSSSVMYILLNKYFCCTVFKKCTFILTDCCEYLHISVFMWYEDSFTRTKRWNAHEVTLRAVLEMLFVCLCPHWDGKRWNHCEHQALVNELNVSEQPCVCSIHTETRRMNMNMQDSYLNRLLLLNVYRYWSISRFDLSVITYFWLIHPNFDKFCDIPR